MTRTRAGTETRTRTGAPATNHANGVSWEEGHRVAMLAVSSNLGRKLRGNIRRRCAFERTTRRQWSVGARTGVESCDRFRYWPVVEGIKGRREWWWWVWVRRWVGVVRGDGS